MSRTVRWRLVDDLDGSPATETVTFGLDGRHFEIDLSDEHAAQLHEVLVRHAEAGRRVEARQGGRARDIAARRPAPARVRARAGARLPAEETVAPALALVPSPADTIVENDGLPDLLRALLAELRDIGREAARLALVALADLVRELAGEILAWLDRLSRPDEPRPAPKIASRSESALIEPRCVRPRPDHG